MKKIAIIAPVEDIYYKSLEILENTGLDNIEVYLATMEEGLKVARQLIENGCEIIITRGGTFLLLESNLDIPIIEIRNNFEDILESVEKSNAKDKIGVVGFRNIIESVDYISKLMDVEVYKIIIDENTDLDKVLDEYKENGVTCFIGDSNVLKVGNILDIKAITISSSYSSIEHSINEALRVAKYTKALQFKNEKNRLTIDNVHEGIIVLDEDCIISDYNLAARNILGVKRSDVIGKHIDKLTKDKTIVECAKKKKNLLAYNTIINNVSIILNSVPIFMGDEFIGIVITFQSTKEYQKNEIKIRRNLNKKGFLAKYTFNDILYQSDVMEETVERAKKYSKLNAPIHIYGETGTGKELFCQSIHNNSLRKNGPFVAINCSAIPANLIESELFGYEKGSFTGASSEGKLGVFELAHGGTLFLDEITELPYDLQSRLLRVIQENQIMRIGGDNIIPINVRIVSASNKRLIKEVEKGKFREDLYYRLNVLELNIPNLEQRKDDVIILSEHFLEKYSKEYNLPKVRLFCQDKNILLNRKYNGNIRELENLMQRLSILNDKKILDLDICIENKKDGTDTLEEMTLKYISKVYSSTGENVQKTCDILGISRSTLWRKLKDL